MANVPFAFAAATGDVPASQLDENFQSLVDTTQALAAAINDLDGQQVAFDDTIGLGASTIQEAIIALYQLIQGGGGGGGGGSPGLDFSNPSNSQYDQLAQGE